MAGEDFDVEAVLQSLSLAEKISLLAGKDFWHTADVPAKGIPSVRMSDGPNGVRGNQFFNGTPAACFPCGTGLGSSFDVNLAREVGDMLGQECHHKGAHVLLGPTMNIQRSPLGGRGFESFSEDPNLSGHLAAAYVQGVQGQKVAATVKHYVGNEQEFERFANDSIIPVRALREIYLEPFRIAQKLSKPECYMSGYNKVNGTHVSENKELLNDILREEWGFEGMIMSDWTGVYSCDTSIKAGLDLEMPGPPVFRGQQISRQMQAGKLFMWDIDERVRKVLGLVKYAKASGIPFGKKETFVDTPELRSLLRKAAQNAIVLLKNEQSVLPIQKGVKKIAVIGSNARVAVTSGGGSASLLSSYTVTPLEGIQTAAKELGAEVEFAVGSSSYLYLPPATKLCSLPEGTKGGERDVGFLEFWLGEPPAVWDEEKAGIQAESEPAYTTPANSMNAFFMDGLPQHVSEGSPYIRFTSTFTADTDGDWEFALGSVGSANLFVDGKLVVNNSSLWCPGELWFGMGSTERRGVVRGLQKGKKYAVEVRCSPRVDLRGSPFKTAGALRVGALPLIDEDKAISEAVAVAKASDVAVVVVGLNEDFESEGYDRKHMDLPGSSNKLVSAVLKANPKTIIVNQTGTPVAMPWVDEAPTLVQAFYGGNDLGNALADVLFGKVNPSSKLPLTFPKRLEDSPSDLCFGITSDTPGKTLYNESIYVGYRFFDKSGIKPLFPFGHGLSYTTFKLSDLSVSTISYEGEFEVKVTVENTGSIAGSEVVQVYVSNPSSTQATPVKELRGFTKVHLAPGKKETVSVKLDRDALRYFDERRNWWIAERAEYVVSVGTSSVDLPLKQRVKLGKTMTWLGL